MQGSGSIDNSDSDDTPYRVLYDAKCEFCRNAMKTLKSLDKNDVVEAMPLSNEAIEQLHVPATVEECLAQMHVISASGKLFVGYFAILKLASLFPQTKLIARAAELAMPRKLGVAIYKLIARNRYGIGKCTSGTCQLP